MLALDSRILEIGLCVSYFEFAEHATLPHFQDVGLLICKFFGLYFYFILFYFWQCTHSLPQSQHVLLEVNSWFLQSVSNLGNHLLSPSICCLPLCRQVFTNTTSFSSQPFRQKVKALSLERLLILTVLKLAPVSRMEELFGISLKHLLVKLTFLSGSLLAGIKCGCSELWCGPQVDACVESMSHQIYPHNHKNK